MAYPLQGSDGYVDWSADSCGSSLVMPSRNKALYTLGFPHSEVGSSQYDCDCKRVVPIESSRPVAPM